MKHENVNFYEFSFTGEVEDKLGHQISFLSEQDIDSYLSRNGANMEVEVKFLPRDNGFSYTVSPTESHLSAGRFFTGNEGIELLKLLTDRLNLHLVAYEGVTFKRFDNVSEEFPVSKETLNAGFNRNNKKLKVK